MTTRCKVTVLISALKEKPQSVDDLAIASEMYPDTVRRWLRAFIDAKHVKPCGHGEARSGMVPILWGWTQ